MNGVHTAVVHKKILLFFEGLQSTCTMNADYLHTQKGINYYLISN